MKVYILDNSNEKYKRIQASCLQKGYEVEVVNNINHLNPATCCIIGCSVDLQYNIFKYLNNINYYHMFDNKMSFYTFLTTNRELWNGLHLIPTYDRSYSGENMNKSFLIKSNNGYAAMFNQIITGNLKDLIQKYADNSQIQEILTVKHILGISLACRFGKILGVYSYNSVGAITAENCRHGFTAIRYNYIKYPAVRYFLKKLIKFTSFNGFLEVEFLIDNNDKIHIMECNPRISGSIRVPQYFELVINEYIKHCLKSKDEVPELDLDNSKLWREI